MGGLFITNLQTDPRFFFAVVITVVISITLHELAHGVVAMWRGDHTPEHSGHMTLNPLVHMGPMSLVMLAIAGIAWGAMPIDPTRLRGKYAESLVSVAGPAANLLLAALALVGLGLWERYDPRTVDTSSQAMLNAKYLLMIFGHYNLLLAIFNLLPVPPLDGSHILANLVPAYHRFLNSQVAQGVMLAAFFALFMGAGRFIVPWTFDVTTQALCAVSGQSEYHFYAIRFPEMLGG